MPDLTYRDLQKGVATMTQLILKGNEALQETSRHISDEGRDTARVAEGIGAMKVDTPTIAETHQAAKNMYGLSDATVQYATAAATTARRAQEVEDVNRADHDAINEAAARSPVGKAIYDLNREWLRQE